ncbi:MAG: VWA domain-containing protein [Deltaproteobacteria bacterium]|nr:VWA domain-containing protein [Deltaproteobacteria bacterium]
MHGVFRCAMMPLVFTAAVIQLSFASPPLVPPGARGSEQISSRSREDKTLSPYFFVKSDNPSVDHLPLKSTSAKVEIAGVIANVTVTQVYKNEGKKALEAVYVFPASTRAAVYGMKMTIGERTVTAQIQKREEARAAYEKAKQEGRSASLLEQQRPNVFQMNVANILPGDEIKTELQYTELIHLSDGVYEFVYPTVVGPRYSNQTSANAPTSEHWLRNPYLHSSEAPPYSFDIDVRLSAGVPVGEMQCTSHRVDIRYEDQSNARVSLAASEKHGGNRDFILKYRLSGDATEAGLLLYEGEREKFFLLMVQPPRSVPLSGIPPREYIFIVDVSGSMNGFPLEVSKRLLKDLIGNLRPTDHFNVLLFSGGSEVLADQSLPASEENIRKALDVIERQRGGGGTELLPALKKALTLPRREGTSRTVAIVTDGYVAVETEAFDLIRRELGRANCFTFGIGSSVNRFLIEGMARAGVGEPFVVTRPDEAPAAAERFRKMILSPLLTGVTVEFGGFEAYDVVPGAIPDVFARRPVLVYGKWRGTPRGVVTVKGTGSDQVYKHDIDVSRVKPLETNGALRHLWARSRIAELSDSNLLHPQDSRVREITRLGLDYSLLTAYTSFVAVDTLVRREGGETTTVQQPLPLPEGVPDSAIAASSGRLMLQGAHPMASPEPAVIRKKTEAQESEAPSFEGKGGTLARQPALRLARVAVSPGLSKSAVQVVFERDLENIRRCLLIATQKRKEIQVILTVDRSGKVTAVRIAPLKGISRAVEHCLRDTMMSWMFSPPGQAASGSVRMTFTIE